LDDKYVQGLGMDACGGWNGAALISNSQQGTDPIVSAAIHQCVRGHGISFDPPPLTSALAHVYPKRCPPFAQSFSDVWRQAFSHGPIWDGLMTTTYQTKNGLHLNIALLTQRRCWPYFVSPAHLDYPSLPGSGRGKWSAVSIIDWGSCPGSPDLRSRFAGGAGLRSAENLHHPRSLEKTRAARLL
jgi:hypothetical protein